MTRAIRVTAGDDYSIEATLEDGRVLKFDMKFLLNQSGPVVEPLRHLAEFKKVFVRNGIVTWPTGYDIDPYYLEARGTPISQSA